MTNRADRRNTGSLLDVHDLRGQIPRAPYLHHCAGCGVPIRRHRQHTNAAWYRRNGLEPKPFPITWHDASGAGDCASPHARRWRKEHGMRGVLHLSLDARHHPITFPQEDST